MWWAVCKKARPDCTLVLTPMFGVHSHCPSAGPPRGNLHVSIDDAFYHGGGGIMWQSRHDQKICRPGSGFAVTSLTPVETPESSGSRRLFEDVRSAVTSFLRNSENMKKLHHAMCWMRKAEKHSGAHVSSGNLLIISFPLIFAPEKWPPLCFLIPIQQNITTVTS